MGSAVSNRFCYIRKSIIQHSHPLHSVRRRSKDFIFCLSLLPHYFFLADTSISVTFHVSNKSPSYIQRKYQVMCLQIVLFIINVLSTTAVQQRAHRHSRNTHLSPTNGISFSAMKATKVRQTLAAFQRVPPSLLPSLFLSRPHVYYQQETSFTVKEVLLSNWPDVIQWPDCSQPMGGGLF